MQATVDNSELAAPRRGRPPGSASAPKPAQADEKFVEVMLRRKYVPEYCFEIDDESDTPRAIILRDEAGKPLLQRDVIEGDRPDKYGARMSIYREVFASCEAGTIISVPRSEAARLINAGVAEMTANTFG